MASRGTSVSRRTGHGFDSQLTLLPGQRLPSGRFIRMGAILMPCFRDGTTRPRNVAEIGPPTAATFFFLAGLALDGMSGQSGRQRDYWSEVPMDLFNSRRV